MSCYATTRVSLCWPPAEPYEDTDTLVLSVHDHFVDVRVKKDHKSIDWAFAGTKRIEADGRHVWSHVIDSRGSQEEDSGYIELLENGDELESGSMRNPETGKIMRHQEVWRSLSLSSASGYIAKENSGKAYAALVENHFLIVKVEDGETSVARYERRSQTDSWSTVFVLDPSQSLRAVDSAWINALEQNDTWSIISSHNLQIT